MANVGALIGVGVLGAAALLGYGIYANRDRIAQATITGVTENITNPFTNWFGSLFGDSEDTPETPSDPEMNPTPATAPDPETNSSNSGTTTPGTTTPGTTTPGTTTPGTTTYTHSGFRSSETTSTARVYRSPGSSGSSRNRNNINNPSNARGSSGGYALPHLRPSPAVSTGLGSSVLSSPTYASRGRASLPAWLR